MDGKIVGTFGVVFLMGVFYAGASWYMIQANAEDIAKNSNHPVTEARVVAVEKDISTIQRDLASIKTIVDDADGKLDDILDAVK